LRPVKLHLRQELEKPHKRITDIYFMEEGIASVVTPGELRDQVEIGIVGPEGMTGTAVVLGNHQSPHATFIQAAGSAQSIDVDPLRQAMETSPSLRRVLLSFAQIFLIQAAETAAANARLRLEGRLARWLLMTGDRLGSNNLAITHEFLSTMLGVRRAGVTDALHFLEGLNLVRAARGTVTIIDREALKKRAGVHYGLPEAEYERLIGGGRR
jgi:CRP-like cAMP-binding protein